MIGIVKNASNPRQLEEARDRLSGLIHNTVTPFTKDYALTRIEDDDSLKNICLAKLNQALGDFIYEDDLDDAQNERRFIAMVRQYMSRALIDEQYRANLMIRKPKTALVSFAIEIGGEESSIEPSDGHQPDPHDVAVAEEILHRTRQDLDDQPEALTILNMLLMRRVPEEIARLTGITVSRVRYLIYNVVQPTVLSYAG